MRVDLTIMRRERGDTTGCLGGAQGGGNDGMEVSRRGIIKNNDSQTRTNSKAMQRRGMGAKLTEVG